MKKLYLLFALFVLVIGVSACEDQNSEDENDNNDNDQDENVDNDDQDPAEDVDQETLDDITEMLASIEDSFEDWEGKRLVNNVEMQDPEDEEKTLSVETRIYIDENTDRIYAETYDETDEDNRVLMNYLYLEDGTVYTYEHADSSPSDVDEDTYLKQDESDREAELPDIDTMFQETLQFFPADHSTAEMQGFEIQDATFEHDEDTEEYQADVEVLMQSSAEEEAKDEVWSIEGDMDEVTIDMPIPTMGTVKFEESSEEDFDDAVESVDTSKHSEEESSEDSE
ncbi:MAG: hypothetical protein ACOC2X_00170 [Bacillota bacterium]